jgi:hypothetical protein
VPELVALLYPFCVFLQGIGLELDEFKSGLLLKYSEDVLSLLIQHRRIPEYSMVSRSHLKVPDMVVSAPRDSRPRNGGSSPRALISTVYLLVLDLGSICALPAHNITQ